ncbi:MAG: response regulator, partial [Nodosilinea sp.]
PYDLIVLDIDLPGLNGVLLCQRLRQRGYAGPILLLTGRSSSTDKVRGLNAGADDYLVKPYTLTELTARIRALLRRPPTVKPLSLGWGMLQLDPNAAQVTVANQPVTLSPKEYGLLELFLRYPDRIFSNTVLLERLWSADETPGEETIRTHIKRLRSKLKRAGSDDVIENVYGMGYRLRPLPAKTLAALGPPLGRTTEGTPSRTDDIEPLSEAIELRETGPTLDQQIVQATARAAAIAAFDRFRPAIDDRLAALHQATAALESGHLPETVRAAAQSAAHKLAGSLGLFGYGAGSHLARRLEDWLHHPNLTEGPVFLALVDQLHQQLRASPSLETAASELAAAPDPPLPQRDRSGDDRYRVLAIDDDPTILDQLQRLLPPRGLDVVPLQDSRQVWGSLAASPPDLVLLDLDMPYLSGLDLCRQLRQCNRWQTLPVVFLTASRDPATVDQLYQNGADDYLPKPILEPELVTRLFHRLERAKLLQTLAGTDPATGLANRQQGTITLDLLLHLAQRYGQTLSLVRVEVDHPPGTAQPLLAPLGSALIGQLRNGDAIARWSQSEILVGILDTDLAMAQAQLQPALESVLAAAIATEPGNFDLYLSGATFPEDGDGLAELYQRACQRRRSIGPTHPRGQPASS